jgi:DNA polymerase-3 subunit epsilon/CBS domain-containing protein
VNSVASGLVDEGLNGLEIARVISTELRTLTARASQLCMNEMKVEGKGEPPADWCILVLGSGGRGESLLVADQDNALIHTGTESDDSWFAEFGDKLADLLNKAGVPYCQGKVMVSSEPWRGTIKQWSKRLDDWMRRSRPDDLLNIDIFFDLAPVAGNFELARKLHLDATHVASTSRTFLALMAQSVRSYAPRFSMFGRLPLQEGRINLKRDGLLPLVGLARTLALRVGSTSRATPERLRDVIAANRIAEGDAERLIELYINLLTVILNQQLEDKRAGIQASSNVAVKKLPRRQYAELMRGLKHLDTMVGEAQSLVSG